MKKTATVMLKPFIILLTVLSMAAPTSAITPRSPSLEDLSEMLKLTGYDLYSFDISDLTNDKHIVTLTIREYERDSLINENILAPYAIQFPTKTMLSELPENFFAHGDSVVAEDAEAGIYRTFKTINIGFYRHAGDSVAIATIDIPESRSMSPQLKLRPLKSYNDLIQYYGKPFKMSDAIPCDGMFVPLALYGSMWVDEHYGVARFCGANEISFDDGDDISITRFSPHYYVVGISVE